MFRFLLLAFVLVPALALGQCPDIATATFTSGIQNREPVDHLSEQRLSTARLYFYTDIRHGKDETVYHDWLRNGELQAHVSLEVGANRWRTWSSKTLHAGRKAAGDQWQVRVKTQTGCNLGTWELTLTNPDSVSAQKETIVPDAMKRIRSLLDAGDTTGARLAIKNALATTEAPVARAQLQRLEQEDWALAQLNQDLDSGNLYVGRARLTALEERLGADHPLANELAQSASRFHTLLGRQAVRFYATLQALQAANRHPALLTQRCSAPNQAQQEWLDAVTPGALRLIAQRSRPDGTLVMEVMEPNSALTGTLRLPCPLPASPAGRS